MDILLYRDSFWSIITWWLLRKSVTFSKWSKKYLNWKFYKLKHSLWYGRNSNFYELPLTKSIVKKGSLQVIIKTQNQEKYMISVLFTIIADGSILHPMIIFKAKYCVNTYKKQQKDPYIINGDCFIEYNENAWSTKSIMNR